MCRLLAAVVAFAVPALPVFAQSGQVGKAPEVNAWPAIIVAVLLSAVILSGSFKSAKRSHQD